MSLVALFVLNILATSGILGVIDVFATDTPTVWIGDYEFFDAANLTCTNFNVTVNISNVTNMKGITVMVGYNVSLLNAVRVYTTPITKSATDWWPVNASLNFNPDRHPVINNTRTYAPDYAYVWVGCWGFPTFAGSGPVFTIKFHIIKAPPRGTVTAPENKSVSCALDVFMMYDSTIFPDEVEVLDIFADPIDHTVSDGLYSYKRPQIVIAAPMAEFTWTPTYPWVNATVDFDASASTPNGGSIVSYAWDFDGDGTVDKPEVGATTTWKYGTIGNYNVTLNVTTSEGTWDTVSHVVEVVPTKPTAEFTWTPIYPGINVTVSFDASASTPNGGSIVSYAWDFDGDGTVDKTEVGATTTWKYYEIRSYDVILNVTDSEGLWDTVLHVVEVRPSTTIFVHPSVSLAAVGETFQIGIIVNNVINLSIFEFKLSYNTTMLDAINVWVMWPDFYTINETAGIIWVNASCPYPYPFSGSGALAVITFKAMESGICVLDLYNTTLIDFYAIPIPHVAVDGIVKVALHGVAIVDIAPSTIGAYPGWDITFTCTAMNEGTESETFWVAVYFNLTATEWILIGNKTITNLIAGAEKTLTFVWDTTGVPVLCVAGKYSIYTFKAMASVVPREFNTTNNVLIDGAVELRFLGDVNGDGIVSGADIGKIKLIMSGFIPKPYYPPYLPDVNGNSIVSGADIGKVKLIISGYIE